jgi:hypothetical protein
MLFVHARNDTFYRAYMSSGSIIFLWPAGSAASFQNDVRSKVLKGLTTWDILHFSDVATIKPDCAILCSGLGHCLLWHHLLSTGAHACQSATVLLSSANCVSSLWKISDRFHAWALDCHVLVIFWPSSVFPGKPHVCGSMVTVPE